MAVSDLQVGRLELAARSLDLTSALLNATSSSSIILRGAWEIGQWLGREKLNQYELLDFMKKSKGLAFANQNGSQFFDQVLSRLERRPVGPLFLQQSGSLGRLMAGDPHLSWIVSSVASLFQHHRDDRIVTEKLTSFIMNSNREEPASRLEASIYSPESNRTRVIAKKIVSSVWYNVVNAGCDTITIPKELLDLCQRGHFLDPDDFGRVVGTIHRHCLSKAILQTDHFLRDVFLWLLLHYDGTLVVTVAGHVVYSANMGNPQRELQFHVKSACHSVPGPDEDPCGVSKEPYKILRHVSGSFKELFSGASFNEFSDLPTRPGVRQKLYDIPRLYPRDSPMFNKGTEMTVKLTAQSIMKWILNVPLSPYTDSSSLGFKATPSLPVLEGQPTVSTILKRFPSMITLQWGNCLGPPVIFMEQPSFNTANKMYWDTEYELAVLLTMFPAMADAQRKVSADCRCPNCARKAEPSYQERPQDILPPLKQGCLRRMVVEEILLLVAHGIADGFGVDDVASTAHPEQIVKGTALLLVELVVEGAVLWETWFALASSVCLGCPFESSIPYIDDATYRGSSFVAMQFGSLATQAPWLDLTQEITIQGCFGLIVSKGRLGVFAGDSDNGPDFRGIEENFAIIETEHVEDITAFCSHNAKPASTLDQRFVPDEDDSRPDSDVILYKTDGIFYRLMYRVKTKNHWRGVDPSDAMSAVTRILPSTTCEHASQPEEMPPFQAKVYTMDEIVGRWPDNIRVYIPTLTKSTSAEDEENGDVFITNILDTHLKKNIALSLSVRRVAVPYYPDNSCLPCAIRHARAEQSGPLWEGEGGNPKDRVLISLSTRLSARDEMRRIGGQL